MPSGTAPASSLRLFVAVYPPRDVAARLLDLLESLGLPEHRRTPIEQIHLTLQFIARVAPCEVEHTIATVERASAGLPPFELVPLSIASLPRRVRPSRARRGPRTSRTVVAMTDTPATLVELKRRLAARLATHGRWHSPRKLYQPE